MTIIDTTLYANGALRLSRHGAGRGGNVLTLVHSDNHTEQLQLTDQGVVDFNNLMTRYAAAVDTPVDEGDAVPLFRAAARIFSY